jgi:hypothetical protein
MPFQKGQSGNPAGRRKGSRSKASEEWKAYCERKVTDHDYLATVDSRLKAGKLAPMLEKAIWDTGAPQESAQATDGRIQVIIGFLDVSSRPAAIEIIATDVTENMATGNMASPARVVLPPSND